jgi:hypothetical protein
MLIELALLFSQSFTAYRARITAKLVETLEKSGLDASLVFYISIKSILMRFLTLKRILPTTDTSRYAYTYIDKP